MMMHGEHRPNPPLVSCQFCAVVVQPVYQGVASFGSAPPMKSTVSSNHPLLGGVAKPANAGEPVAAAAARNRYTHQIVTPMLMAILDVNTLESPENPPMLDAEVRTEGRPNHGRRSPGGSNLWHDLATVRAMYRVSETTGDPKYTAAADAYRATARRMAAHLAMQGKDYSRHFPKIVVEES